MGDGILVQLTINLSPFYKERASAKLNSEDEVDAIFSKVALQELSDTDIASSEDEKFRSFAYHFKERGYQIFLYNKLAFHEAKYIIERAELANNSQSISVILLSFLPMILKKVLTF